MQPGDVYTNDGHWTVDISLCGAQKSKRGLYIPSKKCSSLLCVHFYISFQCSAIDYTRHTLDGAASLLNSNKYFPSRINIKVGASLCFLKSSWEIADNSETCWVLWAQTKWFFVFFFIVVRAHAQSHALWTKKSKIRNKNFTRYPPVRLNSQTLL